MVSNIIMEMLPYSWDILWKWNTGGSFEKLHRPDLDQLCCLSFGDVSRLVFLDGSSAYPEDSTR